MEANLLGLLRLPDVPVVVFERPPLVLSICQLRFTPVLGVANIAYVAPFQRAIQKLYPIASPVQELGFEMQLAPGQPAIPPRTSQASSWQFKSADDTWTLVLATDFLALETRAYRSFDDFSQRFRDAVAALVEHIQPTFGTRLGLRYVNEIRLESGSCRDVISTDLLGPLSVPELSEHTVQAIQQLQLRFGSRQGMNVRHGKFPGGTTVLPLAGQDPDDRPFYLLDIDTFYEVSNAQLATEGIPIDSDLLSRQLDGYNKAIYRLFRWAVTQQYVDTLGVREVGK